MQKELLVLYLYQKNPKPLKGLKSAISDLLLL